MRGQCSVLLLLRDTADTVVALGQRGSLDRQRGLGRGIFGVSCAAAGTGGAVCARTRAGQVAHLLALLCRALQLLRACEADGLGAPRLEPRLHGRLARRLARAAQVAHVHVNHEVVQLEGGRARDHEQVCRGRGILRGRGAARVRE